MSTDLNKQKTGIEIIPAGFTDHHAVDLRITIDDYDLQRRRGRRKVDPTLMADEHPTKDPHRMVEMAEPQTLS
jgi:hypothetical protein